MNICKQVVSAILFIAISFKAVAGDIDLISGKYEYSNYSFTLRNGETKGLGSLGAKKATLEIRKDMTITLAMQMADGTSMAQQAKMVELHISGRKGYWLARWPDVPGLVRKDFTIGDGVISYRIAFSEENGPILNGVTEAGVLKRIP